MVVGLPFSNVMFVLRMQATIIGVIRAPLSNGKGLVGLVTTRIPDEETLIYETEFINL